jgi:putative pyoverdin transport system ATP-binding/permease protein
MYIIMAVIVFILPRMVPSFHQDINQIAATLLFIIGPLGAVVNAFPAYTRVNLALIDIYELEGELDAHFASAPQPTTETAPGFSSFTNLEMENIEFSYTDKEQRPVFSLGPIHFRVTAGETVFVIGGNGSGKSTLFKLMVGLYKPDHGNLKMNSHLVDAARLQSYREMFSSVFSDFHLFDRLYGLRGITTEQVDRWLDEMQLNNKTQFTNGRFSSLDLSSGQRKRLALIIALLEDRPVFVLDEWAAEQDPTFRRYFYTHILAVLKSRGKTVIAITHDEQYFHLADRVLKVDYGKIVETDRGAKKCGASPNPKENPTG